jgi:hypothetical protein
MNLFAKPPPLILSAAKNLSAKPRLSSRIPALPSCTSFRDCPPQAGAARPLPLRAFFARRNLSSPPSDLLFALGLLGDLDLNRANTALKNGAERPVTRYQLAVFASNFKYVPGKLCRELISREHSWERLLTGDRLAFFDSIGWFEWSRRRKQAAEILHIRTQSPARTPDLPRAMNPCRPQPHTIRRGCRSNVRDKLKTLGTDMPRRTSEGRAVRPVRIAAPIVRMCERKHKDTWHRHAAKNF